MSDRQAAVDAAIAEIQKAFGAGAAMRMDQEPQPVRAFSTGCISVDHISGIGGIPIGRVTEISGPFGSGKTTIAIMAAAAAQACGGTVGYIDTEYSIDPVYARNLGVDLDKLIISQPSTAEEAWEIVDILVRTSAVDLLVVDSLAAMVTRQELENDYGSSNVGTSARLNSQAMRKLVGPLAQNNVALILINQLRATIQPFGPSETTTGGRAVPFYASMRLDVRKGEVIKDGDEAVGNMTKVKVTKNKCAPPLKACAVEIVYGEGISRPAELSDLGVSLGLIKKTGAWMTYGEERIQGRKKMIEWLKGNPAVADELEAKIRSAL